MRIPNKITGRLLDAIAASEKICSYLDVPLQHASAAVLRRMKRGGSAEIFLRSIEKMRKAVPEFDAAHVVDRRLSGRNGAGVRGAVRLCAAAQFDWLGVFSYSDEEGTPAFRLGGKVAPREIERRRRQLMKIQKQISRRKRKAAIGREFEVMLEGPSRKPNCFGRRAARCMRRRLTVNFLLTTSANTSRRSRVSFIVAAWWKRTITTWWRSSFRAGRKCVAIWTHRECR